MTHLILALASFLASLISGAAGFGGALLLLPVITWCIGAQAAVPVLTIAQLIGNLSRMAFGFKQIAWKPMGLFCLAALPLSALGALGFAALPKDAITRVVGGAVILLVLFKWASKRELPVGNRAMLIGGALTGLLSGLAGSAGPIGAMTFLTLGLPPTAYIASEATTATAMHLLKTVVYSRFAGLDKSSVLIGLMMGGAMILGTFCANRFIRSMPKDKFQGYVAVLLCAVGLYMLLFRA